MWLREDGDWTKYRKQFGLSETDEIDLHYGPRDRNVTSYDKAMADIEQCVRDRLREAQENGREYIMFNHGHSTSSRGRTTARSVVRGFMRSIKATQFIVRAECIQHSTVFVAKIKNNN
jgi:hypothetical protein